MRPLTHLKWKTVLYSAIVLVAWEGAYQLGFVNPLIFGSPSLIVRAAWTDGFKFLVALRLTLVEIIASGIIACGGGVLFGLVVGSMRRTSVVLMPILSALTAVPLIVLLPVAVAWFGIGAMSKVVFAAALGFFPVALSTMLAVQTIDERYIEMSVAMGARPRQILLQIMVPFALPAVIAGLRIGVILVIVGVLQGEMMAATDGLGYLISYYRSMFETGQVYLGILVAMLFAVAVNNALSRFEQRRRIYAGAE
jgi:NitT/TauT family transport system permease protein/taurine transport system permease protein